MPLRGPLFAMLAVALTACGLDLAGEELVGRPASPGSLGPTAADASLLDAGVVGFDDSSIARDVALPDPSAQGAAAPTAATQTDSGDAAHAGPPGPGAAAPSLDAGTSCALLVQCCPRLLAPPLALACIASAMQDAGEASCAATMATLVDAGICP